MEDTDIANTARSASWAFGPMVLAVVPPAMIPSAKLRTEGRIALPFMECSTSYAVLLISSMLCLLSMSRCLSFVSLYDEWSPSQNLWP